MKFLKLTLCLLICQNLFAQVKPVNLYGVWVAARLSFKDGTDLPEGHNLRLAHFKYTFSEPGKVAFSTIYYDTGVQNNFELNGDVLSISNPQGFTMNSFKVSMIRDTLLMLQRGRDGFDDDDCVLFKLVSEKNYQKSLPLTAANVFSVHNGDTVFSESKKVYAKFIGDSFLSYVYQGLSKKVNMDGKAGRLVAAFTVSKDGIADTPKILSTISEKADARFLKIFAEAKDKWVPAYINDKPVPVRMKVELVYMTGMSVTHSVLLEQKADVAYNAKDYETALFYYEQAFDNNPDSNNAPLRIGMCQMLLGNVKAACATWSKATKSRGNTEIEDAMARYCR